MRIAVVTALHKRYKLTELFLSYYAKYWPHALFAVIDDDDLQMWNLVRRYPEWRFCEHENEPLADKWLRVMKLAMQHKAEFDAVMIVGSDDFIDDTYRKHCETALYLAHREYGDRFGESLMPEMHIQPRYVYYYETATGRMMRIKHKRPGAGRVLTNTLLGKVNWEPWSAGDRNIDGSMDKRLAAVYGGDVPYAYIEDDIGVIMDVKSGESIWSYDYLRKGDLEDLEASEFLPQHFKVLANPLLTWKQHTQATSL